MKISDLMHTIIDEFNEYDVGQISTYWIEGDDCEIKDSFDIDFSLDTIGWHNVMLWIYYNVGSDLQSVIKFSINTAESSAITLLFVFAKMKWLKSIISLQFYHVTCRGIKYDTYGLLYTVYDRNDIVAFESILNADLKNVYESSYLSENSTIDKLFRYNDGTTIFDITEQNISDLIEECSDKPAFVALLLDYKKNHFESKEEDMEL